MYAAFLAAKLYWMTVSLAKRAQRGQRLQTSGELNILQFYGRCGRVRQQQLSYIEFFVLNRQRSLVVMYCSECVITVARRLINAICHHQDMKF